VAKKKVSKQQEHDESVSAEVEEPLSESEESPAAVEESSVDELAAAREEAGKNWDLYLRSQAEMENFRKRMQRDKQDALRFANEGILREILPVIDNLDRAVEHAQDNDAEAEGLLEGVQMTLEQFARTLEKFGVKPVAALGEAFDPACHEAMGQLETAEQAPNSVAKELQKGYMLNDRLLRPALVMVAKAPEVEAADDAQEPPAAAETNDENSQEDNN